MIKIKILFLFDSDLMMPFGRIDHVNKSCYTIIVRRIIMAHQN